MNISFRADTLTLGRVIGINVFLAVLTVLCMILSIRIGSIDIHFGDIISSLFRGIGLLSVDPSQQSLDSIILYVRLPRILLAVVVGGSIAASGAVFQVFIRNVLADPYILGISGGASVGALCAISTGLAGLFSGAVPLLAFAGAAIVAASVYMLGRRQQGGDSNSLLLSGVMIGAFLSSCILVLVSVVGDPVRNALFWLIGYLGNATIADTALLYAVNIPVIILMISRSASLNIFSLGEETASHLGVSPRRTLFLFYSTASLITAVSVSVSGAIGFIGLIIPHVARSIFGADHRLLLPASFFLGAVFLVLSDLLARTLLSPVELPTGAVTATIGAPLFIYLLRRKK